MLSLFLAKVLGTYLVLVCLSVLINKRRMVSMMERVDGGSMYVSGALITILGLLMVVSHNIWTADYRGVVTFFGWLTLFKGVIRIFCGEQATHWVKSTLHSAWYSPLLVIFLLIGVWLAAVGFGWV